MRLLVFLNTLAFATGRLVPVPFDFKTQAIDAKYDIEGALWVLSENQLTVITAANRRVISFSNFRASHLVVEPSYSAVCGENTLLLVRKDKDKPLYLKGDHSECLSVAAQGSLLSLVHKGGILRPDWKSGQLKSFPTIGLDHVKASLYFQGHLCTATGIELRCLVADQWRTVESLRSSIDFLQSDGEELFLGTGEQLKVWNGKSTREVAIEGRLTAMRLEGDDHRYVFDNGHLLQIQGDKKITFRDGPKNASKLSFFKTNIAIVTTSSELLLYRQSSFVTARNAGTTAK